MKSIAEPKYSFGVKYRLYYILFPNHFLKKKNFYNNSTRQKIPIESKTS